MRRAAQLGAAYADALTPADGTIRHQSEDAQRDATGASRRKRVTSRASVASARGFEPRTGGLRVRCSTRLSYAPARIVATPGADASQPEVACDAPRCWVARPPRVRLAVDG